MITLTPLRNNNYYNSINFALDETNLSFNISGVFNNNNINTSLNINPNSLITSITVINNSLTTLYTYLLIDLYSYTYASNSIPFNSSASYQPEFLLYLDNNYTCINDYVNLVISNTNLPLTTKYSYTSGTARFSYTSLSALYSATALYSYTAIYAKNVLTNSYTRKIDIFDIPYSTLHVSKTGLPSTASQYDSVYDYNYKKLYVYIYGSWQEVKWQDYIKRDKIYRDGAIRINSSSGSLDYYFASSSIVEIIPTIGKIVIPTYASWSYIYYIAPNQSFKWSNTNTSFTDNGDFIEYSCKIIIPNKTAFNITAIINKYDFKGIEIDTISSTYTSNRLYTSSNTIKKYYDLNIFNFNNNYYNIIKAQENSELVNVVSINSFTYYNNVFISEIEIWNMSNTYNTEFFEYFIKRIF